MIFQPPFQVLGSGHIVLGFIVLNEMLQRRQRLIQILPNDPQLAISTV